MNFYSVDPSIFITNEGQYYINPHLKLHVQLFT